MSRYPCDLHGRRVAGPLESIRFTAMHGATSVTRRLRVCPTHHEELRREYLGKWELATEEGSSRPTNVCTSCGHTAANSPMPHPTYAYSYQRGLDPEEYWGNYCDDCLELLVRQLKLEPDS